MDKIEEKGERHEPKQWEFWSYNRESGEYEKERKKAGQGEIN